MRFVLILTPSAGEICRIPDSVWSGLLKARDRFHSNRKYHYGANRYHGVKRYNKNDYHFLVNCHEGQTYPGSAVGA